MARSRPALQLAINEILLRHGSEGKRLSLRQAERLTGLSPATIGELAKGNARTAVTLHRFAIALGEDATRLLHLGGFFPEDLVESSPGSQTPEGELTSDEQAMLVRLGSALARLPPGQERSLWADRLRQDAELLELRTENPVHPV